MSEVYIEHHHYEERGNYSGIHGGLDESNRIMLEWIIGIFGAIIGIELLLFILYFKEAIKKYCCRRALRKNGKMLILVELNSKEKKQNENEVSNEGINEDDV